MQSLPTGALSSLAPIQTETELTKWHTVCPATFQFTGQSLCLLVRLHQSSRAAEVTLHSVAQHITVHTDFNNVEKNKSKEGRTPKGTQFLSVPSTSAKRGFG